MHPSLTSSIALTLVEKAVTGIRRIRDEVSVSAIFRPNPEVRAEAGKRPMDQVAGEVRLLRVMSGEMTRQRLQEALGLKHKDHFRKAYLIPALKFGLIEMTIPGKPRSSKQRYRLAAAGSAYLKQTEEKQ